MIQFAVQQMLELSILQLNLILSNDILHLWRWPFFSIRTFLKHQIIGSSRKKPQETFTKRISLPCTVALGTIPASTKSTKNTWMPTPQPSQQQLDIQIQTYSWIFGKKTCATIIHWRKQISHHTLQNFASCLVFSIKSSKASRALVGFPKCREWTIWAILGRFAFDLAQIKIPKSRPFLNINQFWYRIWRWANPPSNEAMALIYLPPSPGRHRRSSYDNGDLDRIGAQPKRSWRPIQQYSGSRSGESKKKKVLSSDQNISSHKAQLTTYFLFIQQCNKFKS